MTDNRTTELLPCPFCGGEADEYEGDYGNGIYCMMCGAMVGEPIHLEYMMTKRVSIDEAIAAWNTRADYHGYEQAAIEAWESIKAWNTRAELGSGTCHITASSTDGLCSDNPRQYFELSCGHSFTLDGLGAPVACAVCGKAVEQWAR